jgi:hypothetical protein
VEDANCALSQALKSALQATAGMEAPVMMPDLRAVAIADQVECVLGTRMRDVDLGKRRFWTSRPYKWDDVDLVDSDIESRCGLGWQSGTGDFVVVVMSIDGESGRRV